MKFLLPLLRNNLLQLSHANQLRYADTKNRTKTITLYMLIAMILMGLLAYLIYSLKIIYSIAWSLEEVVTELVVPMVLICVILNIAISIFWGSGLLLSDTNIDSVLALPIPLRTLILSKLTVLFMVEVALTVALLLPMMVLFGLTAGMGFPFYLIVLGITILFPVIPGLLGTMFGTQIYRILKNSSARIARLKAAAAILILFAFMIFMFCKFPDIAAGNFGDVISTSTFTLYAGQYIHRLLNGDYLLIGIYFGGVFLIGVTLLYGLIKIFRNWYSNDAIQGSKSQPVDWNKQTTKQHSPVSALLERERTRYFSLPVYLTNTACGLLFAAVFVLLVVLMSDKITPYIYQLAEYFQVPFADYDVLFIYAFSILTTISCTTYVSISIEGKQIEILKSLPIAAKCLFRVKLLHHLSMSVPTIFVLNTIMALYLQWSFPTNGLLVDCEKLEFFKEYNVNVGFSVDGISAIHDKYRCGTHERVMANIALYKEVNGKYPSMNCTVGKEIIDNPEATIGFFEKFGNRITFSRMIGKQGISLPDFNAFLNKAMERLNVRTGGYDCTMYGGMCGAGMDNIFYANGKIFICGNCIDLPFSMPYDTPLNEVSFDVIDFDRSCCFKEVFTG